MAAPQFYPALNNLIRPEKLPEPLETAFSTITNKLFYKTYYVEKSVYGDSAYHHLVLLINAQVGLNLFGGEDGFQLLLNPGTASGTTEIPISIYYNLPILKYIRKVKLENLSSVEDYFLLLLDMFNITKEELFFESVEIFLNGYEYPIQEFVNQFNQNPAYDSYPPLTYPTTGDYYTDVIDLIEQLNNRNLDSIIYILNNYINQNSLPEGFDDLNILFNRWVGDFNLDTIVNLFIPKFSASVDVIEVALAFPRTWLKPVDAEDNVIQDDTVKSRLTYSVGSLTYHSEKGLEFLNPDSFDLTPSQIGDTGLLIDIDNLKFDFRKDKNIPEAVGRVF
ncbi:hypothetical protein K8089_08420 [Aequorivita sp. F47161]|uniref:Uncharacterized protein n=1 Tax=Aequorivita vitellina TaxID=2874475 RepID=A0A9X1U1P0_9FLAO|nr:hypothetical protein [Aequorivita vitellina]MCG2419045.1 hypothetical protein [Aequorivita vitellina]